MAPGDFTAEQAQLLFQARALFILQQLIIFPLYFAPGLRGRLGGDVRPKFPCSISWMVRKGAPRLCTLLFWNLGWLLMVRAFFKDGDVASMTATDWGRALFMLQMYATGFVTVVLTPMRGPDVALGSTDALHCYAAMAYVADHFLANQYVLGVPITSYFGGGFVVASLCCGAFQFSRANDDLVARKLYLHAGLGRHLRLATFTHVLECGFMLSENILFLIFLFGLTSGVTVRPVATAS